MLLLGMIRLKGDLISDKRIQAEDFVETQRELVCACQIPLNHPLFSWRTVVRTNQVTHVDLFLIMSQFRNFQFRDETKPLKKCFRSAGQIRRTLLRVTQVKSNVVYMSMSVIGFLSSCRTPQHDFQRFTRQRQDLIA